MKKQKGETIRKIIAAIITVLVILLLAFLITWQPSDEAEMYEGYDVVSKTLEQTLDEVGVVIKHVKDDNEETVAQFFVSEYDVNSLETEKEVTLQVEALDEDGEDVLGVIDSITEEPRIVGDITDYEVIVRFNELPENIRVGMHVDMTVVLETVEDVVAVPNESLYEKDGQMYVDMLTTKRRVRLERLGVDETIQETQAREVTTDFKGDEYTEVTDGLSEGDVIVAN